MTGDHIIRADEVQPGDRLLHIGKLRPVTAVKLGTHPDTGIPYAAITVRAWKYTAGFAAADLVAVRRS